MDIKDFKAIDNATKQYYSMGKISEKCPKCGEVLTLTEIGNSYEVSCINGCLKETCRGI